MPSINEELKRELRLLRETFNCPRRTLLTAGAAHDKEIVDPVPMEMPIDGQRPPTITELIQQYIRAENQPRNEIGTFEEEDDFEEDDPDLLPDLPFEIREYPLEEEDSFLAPAVDNPQGSEATADPGDSPANEGTEGSEAQVVTT